VLFLSLVAGLDEVELVDDDGSASVDGFELAEVLALVDGVASFDVLDDVALLRPKSNKLFCLDMIKHLQQGSS
jgi:hypothetical protein